MGAVVVSASAGRVGVTVSAGVVVSADRKANTAQVKGGRVKQSSGIRSPQRGRINLPMFVSAISYVELHLHERGPGETRT